jgi:hypothetical protein
MFDELVKRRKLRVDVLLPYEVVQRIELHPDRICFDAFAIISSNQRPAPIKRSQLDRE